MCVYVCACVAAVTSLAKFGASCESLRESVCVLLDRCLMDNDDEVRDRAVLYLQVLQQSNKALSSTFVLNRKPHLLWGFHLRYDYSSRIVALCMC